MDKCPICLNDQPLPNFVESHPKDMVILQCGHTLHGACANGSLQCPYRCNQLTGNALELQLTLDTNNLTFPQQDTMTVDVIPAGNRFIHLGCCWYKRSHEGRPDYFYEPNTHFCEKRKGEIAGCCFLPFCMLQCDIESRRKGHRFKHIGSCCGCVCTDLHLSALNPNEHPGACFC